MEIGESPEVGVCFSFTDCPLVATPTAEDRADVIEGGRIELDSKAEIGDLKAGRTAAFDPAANRWPVAADGDNVWLDRNDLWFVHATADGDASVRARLVDADPFSKAGVMIRGGVDAALTYGYVGGTPDFSTELLWRSRPDEAGVSHQLGGRRAGRVWVAILGERLTCFVSDDGDRWTPIDQRPVDRTDRPTPA